MACQVATNKDAPKISGFQPAPAVPRPQVQEPQTNVAVPPVIPAIEVQWVEISKDSIPSEKLSFVPGATAKAQLNFPTDRGGSGYGDGAAFLLQTGGQKDREFFFTPDKGKSGSGYRTFLLVQPFPLWTRVGLSSEERL